MRDVRTLLVCGLAAVAVSACTPDIGPGTYFCGPERLCPPDLQCDDPTFTCESKTIAQEFTCPTGSDMFEPDDDTTSARALDDFTCGSSVLPAYTGCISGGEDIDHVMFTDNMSCMGSDPHLEIRLRFPVAFVPLTLEVLDDQGAVIATGELCTAGNDLTGTDLLCVDLPSAQADYFIRVSTETDGPDCDGDCRHNQYVLDITSRLS